MGAESGADRQRKKQANRDLPQAAGPQLRGAKESKSLVANSTFGNPIQDDFANYDFAGCLFD